MNISSADGRTSEPSFNRPRRVAYLSGPIDALTVAQNSEERQADYYGTVYLAQLLHILDTLNAECLIITTLPGDRWRKVIGSTTIVNIPMSTQLVGASYHLGMIRWSVRCAAEIRRFKAHVAIFTAGQDYHWLFALLHASSCRLIVSLHCTLWPKLAPRRLVNRILTRLNGTYFFPVCDHIQAVSQDIIDQVMAISTKLRAPPRKFVPTYPATGLRFAQPATYPAPDSLFRLLYVGRIEDNKGVFDLIAMMRALHDIEPGRFYLTICGTGLAERALARAVSEAGLESSIALSGQCKAAQLAHHYAECHVVVVPTRSTFEEGYAKVVAEAVLNRRPVVTSAACPALPDVADAAVEARVDDPATYVDAIRKLAGDPILYEQKVAACSRVREIYFDHRHSYGAAIEPALRNALSA